MRKSTNLIIVAVVLFLIFLNSQMNKLNSKFEKTLSSMLDRQENRQTDELNSKSEKTPCTYQVDPSSTTLSSMLELLESQQLQQLERLLKEKPQPQMDDPQLIDIIKKMIHKPANSGVVKLSQAVKATNQSDRVMKILNHKVEGFFVECGGLDGERASNTLYLEQKKNWTGLLVEMDPLFFLQLLGKNRKCHAIHACLSPSIYPSKLEFQESTFGSGKLENGTGKQAVCFPFYSIMEALGQQVIDYFSLDIEGQEYNVLKTIPFDKLDIRVLSVEYIHLKGVGIEILQKLMSEQGYTMYEQIDYKNIDLGIFTHDLIFVKKGIIQT